VRSVVQVHLGPPFFFRRAVGAAGPPASGFPSQGGCSSIGRAPVLQAGGRRFDSGQLHHFLRPANIITTRFPPGWGDSINHFQIFDNRTNLAAFFFVLTKLYGQVTKSIQGMPRRRKAMKDVASCDKPRGVAQQTLIRGFPNGETHSVEDGVSSSEYIG
jgi:hypothetical protein